MPLLIIFLSLIGILLMGITLKGMHIGLAAFSASWIISLLFPSINSPDVSQFLPVKLLLNLTGISLLFLLAEGNGTLGKISDGIRALAGRRTMLIPLTVFASAAILSAFGLGNIGCTAIAAAPAMRIAQDIRLSPFLMTLIVVGGANSTALSPFSVTGLLNRELLDKQGITDLSLLTWQNFLVCFLLVASIHLLGFYLLGGWKWSQKHLPAMSSQKQKAAWTTKQKLTASSLGIFVLLLFLAGNFNWSIIRDNIGMTALVFVNILTILKISDARLSIQRMPWDTIILIGGMYALMNLMESAGYLQFFEQLISTATGSLIIILALSLAAGSLSAFSSSSGVVMPLFLPLATHILASDSQLSFLGITSIILFSAHLVDTSPFSTLGAICISNMAADDEPGRKKTFYYLTLWGIAMIPCAVLVSFLIYLIDVR